MPFRGILSPNRSLKMHRMDMSPVLKQAAEAYLKEGPRLLMADMMELAELYRHVSGHQNLRVRLEKITTDSCRKFHVDCVDLRLLRTYVGPGVQWTGDEGRTVQEAPTGAVVFLKGKHFPGWDDAEKILHRSPPLSKRPVAERVRLLLTIDEANACADAPFDMVA
ncbi:DUF1826 domain-containing protein [Gluconobacter roseus]|uniref:DUF1826 domain-containing protein n=1 Tax=Gluconobacter roseus TaxID=586239 RepID=UPI001E609561|nr:DUF1826 domain-containing protein [Gluconobacter roseus]